MSGLTYKWVAAALLAAAVGTAQSAPVFQGRLADGSASSTCTVSGANRCTMFYNTTLDITILNNWNFGEGTWDADAGPGSVQALIAPWSLPTGDGDALAGQQNQYLSIWNDVGGTLAGLQAQFFGVRETCYWSSTVDARDNESAWYFYSGGGDQGTQEKDRPYCRAVAVRPGDVAPVPEPRTLALALLALGIAGCCVPKHGDANPIELARIGRQL